MTDYDEIRLRFERKNGSYEVFASGAVGGEVGGPFSLPFSDLELENIVLRLGGARRGVRRVNSPEMKLAEEFGTKLFGALFQGRVRDLYRTCASRAKDGDKGLRLTLCLSDTPELMHLPWEYLYDDPDFLSTREDSPIVRYLDLPSAPRPLHVELPLRILAMVSAPRDAPGLDVAQERRNLEQAVEELTRANAVEITWLEQATLLALLDKLQSGTYHVFHYIGHGGYDEGADDGVLLLEDQNGLGQRVTGGRLATILCNHDSLRLAVLNACEGARTSRTDPFAGVAASLVQREVPAVIAMQFEITDRAAILFAAQFYKALARGNPVDAALAWARLAIFADQNDIEWGTPVLIMRAANGRIFDVPKPRGGGLTLEVPPAVAAKFPPPPAPPVETPPLEEKSEPPPPALPERPAAPEGGGPVARGSRRTWIVAALVVAAGLGALLAFLLLRGGSTTAATTGSTSTPTSGTGGASLPDLSWSFQRVTRSRLPGHQEIRALARLADQTIVAVGFDRPRLGLTLPLALQRGPDGWTRQAIEGAGPVGRQVMTGVAESGAAVVTSGTTIPPGAGELAQDAAAWRRDVSGGPWRPACRSEAVCGDKYPGGGFQSQAMWAVVARKNGGFVAVGYDVLNAHFDAVAWLSADGATWRRAGEDADNLGGGRDQEMRAVIETSAGMLVAVGGDKGNGAVWTSPTGAHWTKKALPACQACVKLILYGVAETSNGDLVAVGAESLPSGRDQAAIWRRVQGGDWQEIDTGLEHGGQRLLGVVGGVSSLVAVGYDHADGRQVAAVWRSTDGLEWKAEDEPVFAGKGTREINGAFVDADGTVVAGGDVESPVNPGNADQQDGGVWIGTPKGG